MRKETRIFLAVLMAAGMTAFSEPECDDSGVCKLPGSSGDAEKSVPAAGDGCGGQRKRGRVTVWRSASEDR